MKKQILCEAIRTRRLVSFLYDGNGPNNRRDAFGLCFNDASMTPEQRQTALDIIGKDLDDIGNGLFNGLQNASNFVAGVGDGFTDGGISQVSDELNNSLGLPSGVDRNSDAYKNGNSLGDKLDKAKTIIERVINFGDGV